MIFDITVTPAQHTIIFVLCFWRVMAKAEKEAIIIVLALLVTIFQCCVIEFGDAVIVQVGTFIINSSTFVNII